MPELAFVSSYTRILLSLLGPEIPELVRHAQQYSATTAKRHGSQLSPKQIQEAYSHPSAIIQQTLKAISAIQNALNQADAKLAIITDQRSKIEAILTELHTVEAKGIQPQVSADDIKKELLQLQEAEASIESAKAKLKQDRDNIDKMLSQHEQEWLQHRETYFNQLATQLETNGIALNDAEKAELRRGSATLSSIREKLMALEKLKIEISQNASDFAIAAYDAVVAELSRTLQKIDNKIVRDIIKKLPVIDDENEASSKLKAAHAKSYQEISGTTQKLEEQIRQTAVLSPDELQRQLERMKKQATAPVVTEEATPN